ncbi:hypothetical protein [Achromobacter marplatensis]|uniref:hypothetical protein n=1 Tax=Achromobacter marplatensis TaxID=470868 RepID=UPI0028E8B23C|nr:hypothetical protein [Achromobacter marplatensis]
MELIKASTHTMRTKDGRMIEYARLTYRLPRSALGQSLLLSRLSPEMRRLIKAGYPAPAS